MLIKYESEFCHWWHSASLEILSELYLSVLFCFNERGESFRRVCSQFVTCLKTQLTELGWNCQTGDDQIWRLCWCVADLSPPHAIVLFSWDVGMFLSRAPCWKWVFWTPLLGYIFTEQASVNFSVSCNLMQNWCSAWWNTHTGLQLKLKANVFLQNFMETSGFLEHSHWVTWLTKWLVEM